jgi:hypothetical protein
MCDYDHCSLGTKYLVYANKSKRDFSIMSCSKPEHIIDAVKKTMERTGSLTAIVENVDT